MENKEPKPIYYYGKRVGFAWKNPPKWVKEKIIQTVGKCQICGKKENLEVHRVKRKHSGGLYTLIRPFNHPKQNCQVLCSKHHKEVHSLESGMINK